MAKKNKSEEAEVVESNGLGVGVYYDEKLGKFVLVTLELHPDQDSAVISSSQPLNSSKMAAILKANVTLEQLLKKLK